MSASDTQAPPEQEPPAASEQHGPAVHEQPISDDDEPQSEWASGTERLDPHAEESPEDVIADRQRRRREALGATQDHPTSLIGDAGTPGTGAARTGADPRPPLRITDVPAVIAGARPAATRRTATGTASVAVAMRRRPASASRWCLRFRAALSRTLRTRCAWSCGRRIPKRESGSCGISIN